MKKPKPLKFEWSVRKVGLKWKEAPTEDETSIQQRRWAWDLTCPAGHRLTHPTDEEFPKPQDVDCPDCKRTYPAKFESKMGSPERTPGRRPFLT